MVLRPRNVLADAQASILTTRSMRSKVEIPYVDYGHVSHGLCSFNGNPYNGRVPLLKDP